jgi:hypothetical protein
MAKKRRILILLLNIIPNFICKGYTYIYLVGVISMIDMKLIFKIIIIIFRKIIMYSEQQNIITIISLYNLFILIFL